MGTTKIKTDATFAYLKAMGNRQGPHTLAAELVATSLARQFGLTVPDSAIIQISKDQCFALPRNAIVEPGPAFLSRHLDGRTWGGSEAELRTVENISDITRLVVFDTWLRNCDRYPPDLATRKPNYSNVYLADTDRSSRCRLIAIDHTHCFDCGRDLSERLLQIDIMRDDRTFGLFPSFSQFIDQSELIWCGSILRSITIEAAANAVNQIPLEWQVPEVARTALVNLVHGRAGYLADKIDSGWYPSALDAAAL